jgi:hypothetical protein
LCSAGLWYGLFAGQQFRRPRKQTQERAHTFIQAHSASKENAGGLTQRNAEVTSAAPDGGGGTLLDVRRRRGRELGEFDLRGHGHTALRLLDPREVAGEESGMKLVHAPQAVGPASNQRHPRVDLE